MSNWSITIFEQPQLCPASAARSIQTDVLKTTSQQGVIGYEKYAISRIFLYYDHDSISGNAVTKCRNSRSSLAILEVSIAGYLICPQRQVRILVFG
jgi:hypothetical protein